MANPKPKSAPAFKFVEITPIHVVGATPLRFLTSFSQLSDTWIPNWTSQEVYGRQDRVGFFQGVAREINIGLNVYADSEKGSAENMLKLEKLIQYQYPTYRRTASGQSVLKAPPYFKFTWLNAFSSTNSSNTLYGYINGQISIDTRPTEADFHFNKSRNPNLVFFSEVQVIFRLQVTHQGEMLGWTDVGEFKMGENYPYGVSDEDVEKLGGKVTAEKVEFTPMTQNPSRLNDASLDKLAQDEGVVPQNTDVISEADQAARVKEANRFLNIKPKVDVSEKILGLS